MLQLAQVLRSWWKEERRTPLDIRPSRRSVGILLLVIMPLIGLHLQVRISTLLRQLQASRDDTIALMETALSSTNRIARDWGQWEDAYRFARGANPDYVRNNLETGALFDAGGIMVMLRPNGSLLLVHAAPRFRLTSYSALIDCARHNQGPFPTLRSTIRVACEADNGSLYLGTATPVSNNTATAPAAGTVVMFDPLLRREYKEAIRRRLASLRRELVFVPRQNPGSSDVETIQPLIRSRNDSVLAMRRPALLPILGRSLVDDLPLLTAIPLLALSLRALALLARRRRRIVLRQAERRANHRIRQACRQLDDLVQGLWPGADPMSNPSPLLDPLHKQEATSRNRPLEPPAPTPGQAIPGRDLARVSERLQRVLRSASNLAMLDSLTQIPNRRYFLAQMHETATRHRLDGQQFALLFVDVDKFKVINDSYGHATGDAVLVSVTQRLQAVLGPNDFMARYGGDELAVILDLSHLEDQSWQSLCRAARKSAQAMVDSLVEPVLVGKLPIAVSLSIGITLIDPREADVAAMIQRSDLAMYQAKRSRHSRVIGPSDVGMAPHLNSYELFSDLMQAIRGRQLQVFFQPIVNSQGCRHGFEALARWRHPRRDWIEPNCFLELAEQHRQTQLLGDELMRLSLNGFQQLYCCYPGIRYYLNLAPCQLLDPQLADRLLGECSSRELPAELITVELTEHSILEPHAAVGANLHSLRQAGMRLALDDFGTGYSSLVLLKTLRPDMVKIDKSFVQVMHHDVDARHIIMLIAALAPRLEIELIAEGLEDRATLSLLEELGISLFQGFEFGRPAALEAWLADAVSGTQASGRTTSPTQPATSPARRLVWQGD